MKNFKNWKVISALVLVAVLASLGGMQVAASDNRSEVAGGDVIFTKWVTTAGTAPVVLNMEGVVSGDSGPGKFTGEGLEYNNPTAPISTIVADYRIHGKTHDFTARLNVTMDNTKGTGVLKGTVTEGWMKGAAVSGDFQVIAPSGIINAQQGVAGDVAFQGTLHIQRR